MSNKINMVINLCILGLLMYLAVGVNDIKKEVVWPEGYMKPLIKEQYWKKQYKYPAQTRINFLKGPC